MLTIEKKVEIQRQISEVYDCVTDVISAPRWASMIVEVVVNTEGPIRLGSKGYNVMKLLWKESKVGWVISELEQNRSFTVRSTFGPINGIYYYRFKSEGENTILSLRVEVEPRGFYKVLEHIFEPSIQNQIGNDLEKLKSLLENQQTINR
jgi:uncharacterized membrane protein